MIYVRKFFFLPVLLFLITFLLMNVANYAQNLEWINYTHHGLVSDIVDDGDDIWIGTCGGLIRLNKATDSLTFFNKANSGLPGNCILTLTIDSSRNIWMGTRRNGIGSFDGENCVVYHTGNSGLPHDQWNSEIAIDPEGNIWIGSLRFLSIFDGNNWSVFEIESPLSAFSKISDIEFDRDGNAWIAWIGAMWGLGKIDELELIECNEVKSAVNAIAIDKNDYPWFGTDGEGLIKFDQDQINITKFDTSNSNIPDNTVFSMKYDSKENLWLTTCKGLACFDGTNFKVYNTDNSDLPKNSVFAIEIDAQDNIWLGLFHKGLVKFDGTNWKKYDLINSGIVNNHVTSIASDVNSNTWISCHSVLSQFDGINWTLYDQANFEILDSYFNRVYDNRSRAIWTGSDLLISFYKDTNYWGAYNIYNLHKGNHAKMDKEGNIWLSGNEGLCKFDGQNWTIFNKDNSPLPSNAIRKLAIDDNNNLWLSTFPVSFNTDFHRVNNRQNYT